MAYVEMLMNFDGMASQIHNIAETATITKFSKTI